MAYPTFMRDASGNEFGLEPASAVQDLPTATTQIVPNGNLIPVTASAGDVTLTGVQTILPSVNGHQITLMNIAGNGAHIALMDDSLGGGTKMFLGGPPRIHLHPGQSFRLIYSTLLGGWTVTGAIPKYSDFVYDPSTPPATPNAMDDLFDDTYGMSGSSNGLNPKWATRNYSTTTTTFPQKGVLAQTLPASNINSWRILEQAVAAGNFSFSVYAGMTTAQVDFAGVGLLCIDRTNGDFYVIYLSFRAGPINMSVQTWTDALTFSSSQYGQVFGGTAAYLRIDRVSTTLTFYISTDRLNWARLASFTDSVTVNGIAIATYEQNNSGISVGYFRDFRRDV